LYGRGQQQVRFGPPTTPDVIKGVIAANVFVYLLQQYAGASGWLVIQPAAFWENGEVWRAFTYMWAHGGLMHLGLNMFVLWMFGADVANHWGPQRFLVYYLVSGTGAGVIIASWPAFAHAMDPTAVSYVMPTLGASGAVYAVLLASSLLWPNRTVMLLFPPIPLRAIYLIPLLFFMEILGSDPRVSHVGHLGGVAVGWLMLWRWGIARWLTIAQIKVRIRRFKMRRRLRSVQVEDLQARRARNERARQRRREERDRDGGWMH